MIQSYCYTDATSTNGLTELYNEYPNEAHIIMRAFTEKVEVTSTITLREAARSGYYLPSMPEDIRNPKRLRKHRQNLCNMLDYFPEDYTVREITELDLFYYRFHLSFDLTTVYCKDGKISDKELAEHAKIRKHFTSATLKHFRTMVYNIQSQMPNKEDRVLPKFDKKWRLNGQFNQSDWDDFNHPLNRFLVHHQQEGIFAGFDIGMYTGNLSAFQDSNRLEVQAEYQRKQRQKKPPPPSRRKRMLNPLDLVVWRPSRG